MKAGVAATLDLALQASGLHEAKLTPRPLFDDGSSYIAADLARWLEAWNIKHVRGAPYHPMTQGYLPGDLEAFVADYNQHRYRESIDNPIPTDVYFGGGPIILEELAAPAAGCMTSPIR
jgi:putative transposase